MESSSSLNRNDHQNRSNYEKSILYFDDFHSGKNYYQNDFASQSKFCLQSQHEEENENYNGNYIEYNFDDFQSYFKF